MLSSLLKSARTTRSPIDATLTSVVGYIGALCTRMQSDGCSADMSPQRIACVPAPRVNIHASAWKNSANTFSAVSVHTGLCTAVLSPKSPVERNSEPLKCFVMISTNANCFSIAPRRLTDSSGYARISVCPLSVRKIFSDFLLIFFLSNSL